MKITTRLLVCGIKSKSKEEQKARKRIRNRTQVTLVYNPPANIQPCNDVFTEDEQKREGKDEVGEQKYNNVVTPKEMEALQDEKGPSYMMIP